MEIHSLQELDEALRSGMVLAIDNGSVTSKVDVTTIEKHAIESYAGSTLAGSARSVQAAINAISPQVKTAITDLSTILPGEQGYFQLDSSVSPIGSTAYFTVWCTGNADRRGLIAVYTVASTTSVYMNAGHASSGTFAWRGWKQYAAMDEAVLVSGTAENVTASTDVDDYVTPGTYFFNSGTKAANAPNNSGYFRLEVVAPTGSLTGTNRVRYQRALTSEGVTYTRLLASANSGSTWTAQDWIPDPGFSSADRLIIAANSDLNTFTAPGAYRSTESAVTATLTNCPVTSYGFNLDVVQVGVRHFVYQRLTHYTGSLATAVINEYYRFINARDSIVGAWTKVPTRAEVDALSANTYEEIASDASSGTVNISRYGKMRILTFTDVVASGNALNLSAALATTDRPRVITGGVLFASDNSVARVWVRLAGTIGTANVTSGKTYNGELVYIVA